jgi:mannose-1-phosphate guanylyltransferase
MSTSRPIYAVILAGGSGTRLWPLSREAAPKQFLSLTPGGRSLLQEAVRRAQILVSPPEIDGSKLPQAIEQVMVITQSRHAGLVREQLPELPEANLILEPVGRNTAPALGLAAFSLQQRSPGAIMLAFPVDHLFVDEQPWFEALGAAGVFAGQTRALVTIGVTPAAPSPRFGYLHLGLQVTEIGQPAIHQVRAFIEKPDERRARQFCESGEYLWNTGTFAWQVDVFLEAMQAHAPGLYRSLSALNESGMHASQFATLYPTLENISVDYAIMEKAAGDGQPGDLAPVVAVRGAFERIDVGALDALDQVWSLDEAQNATDSLLAEIDSRQNIVFSDEGLVGLIGVEDLIVIRKDDILLVCQRQRAAEVPDLLRQLRQRSLERYL